MRNKETGEFELVVGDRQLLSGFFIVVLLLAVVFAMGYVVGQNSPHSAKADLAATTPPVPAETHPPAASGPPPPAAPPPPTEPPAGDASQQAAAEPPPQPTTQPARETAPANPPPPATPPAAPPGSYWQVMACKNPADAQDLLQTLKDGGMPAFLRTDADKLTHLVVGPYSDAASKAKAKSDLETRFGLHPFAPK
ncbi:MAG: SPOR domain-containing protein [Bryobacteraceae bacterium]|jgi:cell division septation protein DedD